MDSSRKRKRQTAFPSAFPTPFSRTSRSRVHGTAPPVFERPYSSQNPSSSSQMPSASGPSHLNITTEATVNSSEPGRSDDDDLDQVIMAIDMRDSGTVGCSYFSAQEERLYLLGDMRSAGTELIDSLILQIKPTILLTSTRVDHLCTRSRQVFGEDGNHLYLPYQIDVRPSQEFGYYNARNKLIALDIPSMHDQRVQLLIPHNGLANSDEVDAENVGFTKQDGKLLHLSSSIDMENTITIGCAGAILTFVQRRRTAELSTGDRIGNALRVNSVEMSTLDGTMSLNGNTMLCLQIIQSESHPNVFNQGPGKSSSFSKEGLSIYGIFRRFAYTPQGKTRLRQYFLRPSIDEKVICERHDFISVFLRPDNFTALDKLVKSLKHIKNLRSVMVNLRKGVSTGSGKIIGFKTTVWATLLAFAYYGIDIQDGLREVSGGQMLGLRTKALATLERAQLYSVGKMIQEIVDIDRSEEQSRTVVNSGIDRELDEMKDRYDGLSSLLKQVALDVATTIPASLDIDVNVIYFPQLGFNIAIPLNEIGGAAYDGSNEGWDLIFVTENRAYFKDFRMKEMDGQLGDIYGLICEKEIEIVYELAQRLLEFEDVLIEASDLCGEIDSLLAMAQAASTYKLVRPTMTQQSVIEIKGGRHLLQELTVPTYVPNDTTLVGGIAEAGLMQIYPEMSESISEALGITDGPSMLLLTGPNYSGKSVYMKQVALIVYLAQVGSFVPAEKAKLGITDKILTRMNAPESVSKKQSTFMNDLQQISLDLKQVTSRSLVIIDEFGKGTNKSDGIGLACGILEHLLRLDEAPRVIAATHFHEIFEHGFLEPRPRLQLGHMEVQVCEEYEKLEDQVTYLYNFRLGRSDKSFGTICAAMNGISPTIVSRANELAALSARGENLIAICARMSAGEAELLEEAESLARKFLQLDLLSSGDKTVRDVLEDLFEGL